MGEHEFLVMLETDGRAWSTAPRYRAWNPREAAEKFVSDHHEFLCFRREVAVRVMAVEWGEVEKVTVIAEPASFTFKACC